MKTAERLQDYYDFAPEVIDQVAEFAEYQARFETYEDFLVTSGVTELAIGAKDNHAIDIRPYDHDPAEALVVHLPMANPLDPNQLYQLATIAGTNPNKRVIAFGNPSGPGYSTGVLETSGERSSVAHGRFLPVVRPLLSYLSGQSIDKVSHYGYSYGVEKMLRAALSNDCEVPAAIAFEPASVVPRNIVALGKAFKDSAPALDQYVKAPELQTFLDARADSVQKLGNLGLLRATNIAITRGIGRGHFLERANLLSSLHPEATLTVAWGSESELCPDDVMSEHARWLSNHRGAQLIRLVGQKHAAANDIHLQAALVLQGQLPIGKR